MCSVLESASRTGYKTALGLGVREKEGGGRGEKGLGGRVEVRMLWGRE